MTPLLAAIPEAVTAVVIECTIPLAFTVAVIGLLLGLGAAARQSRLDRQAHPTATTVPPAPVE